MSKMCELCYDDVMDYENVYNVGYGNCAEWVCEQCFMDFAKEEYPEVCEDYCFVATAIADALGYEYKEVEELTHFWENFNIDHKIDDLKGGDF